MKKSRKPNGRNIEISLELLELSLILKKSVKKAIKKMVSIVESFRKAITFIEELQREGLIKDYALIGGLALSAWVKP